MMILLFAFLLTLIAGMCNGSYPGPLKRLADLNQDLVWACFSFVAFLLLPWITILLIVPHYHELLALLPERFFKICILGGFLYGLGMACFTVALRFIGIGIAFVLNVSLGTIFGSLLPMFIISPEKIFTRFGVVDLLALLFFIMSVICSSRAASIRDLSQQKANAHKNLWIGLLMGVLSGILCSAQGAAFGLAMPILTETASVHHISGHILSLPWTIIFTGAFVPYFLIYFLKGVKTVKTQIGQALCAIGKRGYYLLIMGGLYYLSLVIYSFAVGMLGSYGNVIGWPLLMAAIILTSNFWGWKRGEWDTAPSYSKRLMWFSIIFMIVAVILLGVGASVTN